MRSATRRIRAYAERHERNACAVAVLAVALTVSSTSQVVPQLSDTVSLQPQIAYGVSQVAFTSLFFGDALIRQSVWGGSFLLQQRYRGASLLTGTPSYRDDEQLRADWRFRLSPQLDLFPRIEWDVSNDSRSLGISRLERVRLVGGVGYSWSAGNTELYGGGERTIQLGVEEHGIVFGSRTYSLLSVGDLAARADLSGQFVRLSLRRNADATAQIELATTAGSDFVPFTLRVGYQRQLRDYFTLLGLGTQRALEHRDEERWTVAGSLQQSAGRWLLLTVQPEMQIAAVERYFDSPDVQSSLTFVRRRLDELNGSVVATISVMVPNMLHTLGLAIYRRDESNATLDRFEPPAPQLVEDVRQSERMRDNITHRTRLWGESFIEMGRRDTLHLSAQSSIVRYDTPSTLNYDDRDELSLGVRLSLARTWSSSLVSRTTFEYAGVHLVFLRAQRSALSNWNRSFRLASRFAYVHSAIGWFPSVEILAQYTSYDFEGRSGVPSSFSFRQFIYRDSIELRTTHAEVQAQLYFRWFLRGDFSWERFAERPTGSGYEQFIRLLLWRPFTSDLAIGMGCRWYALVQEMSLSSLSQLSSAQRSIAPDVALRLRTDLVELTLSGWYELRRTLGSSVQILPNVQLNVVHRL